MFHSLAIWSKRLLSEPLVPFGLLGGALFVAYSLLTPDTAASSAERIVFSQARLEHLAKLYERDLGKRPTEQQLRGIVERALKDEVLYREALALGLDREDPVVRRRLTQKMEFILGEQAMAAVDAGTAALRRYYERNQEAYRQAPRVSFSHVFFSRDRRSSAEQDAVDALATLRKADAQTGDSLGDPFVEDRSVQAASEAQLAARFGAAFAGTVLSLSTQRWIGPIESTFGWHLVRVTDKLPGEVASFENVRARVAEDWREAERQAAVERAYEAARARYEVEIEWPPKVASPGARSPSP